ncbi:class I SAM-dependent methyltransferase [Ectobacillus panaciterrae]|uniref:class I SAM-dependent methyltransferase n=1 Tax=Ectobacillus panaciterrae TaxID=363872 RepID=UPI000422087B|nr:class I SAM-dependent methyltransferase [Ectobacillus panaciterrae]
MTYSYIDLLALLGVGSAHPGGFSQTKQLLRSLPITSKTSVFDAGCGTGRTAAYIANEYRCPVTALDLNPMMLEKAKKRMQREKAAVTLMQGNVEQLPFPDSSFDLVLTESVAAFTHIQKTLKEMNRVLKPNGYLAGIEMTVERTLRPDEKAEIQRLYGANEYLTEAEWYNRLQHAGFSNVQIVHGSTAAASQYTAEQPDWDLSSQIDASVYSVWAHHETILAKYGHLLGHRVFICQK